MEWQQEELIRAAALLKIVQDSLDIASDECGECGHRRYANFNEKQAYEQLSGAITRIERVQHLLNRAEATPRTVPGTSLHEHGLAFDMWSKDMAWLRKVWEYWGWTRLTTE